MSGHGHGGGEHGGNKGIAILISVLAACLAVAEMGGKSAQTASIAKNIEAANTWAFFQAKTIRQTSLRTAGEQLTALEVKSELVQKQIADWKATVERYETEPSTGEGRRELAKKAKEAETARDHLLAAYHQFEYSSAAYQLAIVLASASVITSVTALAVIAGGLGIVGFALTLIGYLAPTLIHL